MRAVGLLAAGAIVLASCTGNGSGGTAPSPTGSPTEAAAAPGTYLYDFNGVTATFRLRGDEGTLEVRNGTDTRLGAPRLSLLAADGAEPVAASVEGPGSLAAGARVPFGVSLPEPLHPSDVGLVVLSFGNDVWGAFSPSRPGG
jgi:hypothetical protein